MTNIAFILLSVSLLTNANVLEVRGPGFHPKFSPEKDHVFVTNVTMLRQVIKVTWDGGSEIRTNLVPLKTNVTRWGWKEEPLKPARDPLAYPMPPMPTDRNIYLTNHPVEWLTNLPAPWHTNFSTDVLSKP